MDELRYRVVRRGEGLLEPEWVAAFKHPADAVSYVDRYQPFQIGFRLEVRDGPDLFYRVAGS